MRIFRIALLLVHAFVASRLTSGAAVDRQDSERQHTAVINLMGTRHDRMEEAGVAARTTAEYEESYNDAEYYYDEEEEEEDEELSGEEVELPRVAMSSKPKDSSSILEAERTERPQRRLNRKRKGQGRKRNPCLKKYKNYCIHGTCHYLKDIRVASCLCHPNYSGERCEFASLRVEGKPQEGYSRTTALAVVAVVLSSLCLTIIGLLLALRFHKRGAYDIENEEKVKLGLAPHH